MTEKNIKLAQLLLSEGNGHKLNPIQPFTEPPTDVATNENNLGNGQRKLIVPNPCHEKVGDISTLIISSQNILCECQPNETGAAVPTVTSFVDSCNKISSPSPKQHSSPKDPEENFYDALEDRICENFEHQPPTSTIVLKSDNSKQEIKPSLIPKLSRPNSKEKRLSTPTNRSNTSSTNSLNKAPVNKPICRPKSGVEVKPETCIQWDRNSHTSPSRNAPIRPQSCSKATPKNVTSIEAEKLQKKVASVRSEMEKVLITKLFQKISEMKLESEKLKETEKILNSVNLRGKAEVLEYMCTLITDISNISDQLYKNDPDRLENIPLKTTPRNSDVVNLSNTMCKTITRICFHLMALKDFLETKTRDVGNSKCNLSRREIKPNNCEASKCSLSKRDDKPSGVWDSKCNLNRRPSKPSSAYGSKCSLSRKEGKPNDVSESEGYNKKTPQKNYALNKKVNIKETDERKLKKETFTSIKDELKCYINNKKPVCKNDVECKIKTKHSSEKDEVKSHLRNKSNNYKKNVCETERKFKEEKDKLKCCPTVKQEVHDLECKMKTKNSSDVKNEIKCCVNTNDTSNCDVICKLENKKTENNVKDELTSEIPHSNEINAECEIKAEESVDGSDNKIEDVNMCSIEKKEPSQPEMKDPLKNSTADLPLDPLEKITIESEVTTDLVESTSTSDVSTGGGSPTKIKRCPKNFTLPVYSKFSLQTGEGLPENLPENKKSEIIKIKSSTECCYPSEMIPIVDQTMTESVEKYHLIICKSADYIGKCHIQQKSKLNIDCKCSQSLKNLKKMIM